MAFAGPDNQFLRMWREEPRVLMAAGGLAHFYQLQYVTLEDDQSFPRNHEVVRTNHGVLVRSLRPIAKPRTLGLMVRELNKVPAGVAGPAAGTSAQDRKDFAAAVARMSGVSDVAAVHNYGATGRVYRSADHEHVLGGIKIPNKQFDTTELERELFELGYDVEKMVEAGRQCVERRLGNLPAVDLTGFESTFEREARIAREEAEEAERANRSSAKRLMFAVGQWVSPPAK